VVDTSAPVANAPRSAPGMLTAAAPKGWQARTTARLSPAQASSPPNLPNSLLTVSARGQDTAPEAARKNAGNRNLERDLELERYRASAPPWMAQAICTTPSAKGL
jgi:hypothetical protein